MTQNPNLAALSEAGVSVWLDDLSRDRLQTGNLQELIDTKGVVGVTTNPSIFQAALSKGNAYDDQVKELAERGADVDATIRTVTTDDVRNACDVLAKQYERSDGIDGRVSIEVDPRLAHDTDKTILQAIELWKIVDRPNLLIKIPATEAGLPAITAVIAEGISVNVTLIFSVERHRAVMDAYLAGLEKAKEAGHDLSRIHSVASFFVSRVDTEIDARLEKIGSDEALALRGKAGVANARLAYAAYEEVFVGGSRFEPLKADGARVQRPLWASTGVKNPDYSDTLYVTELVAPNTVNTMPEKTMDAVADHGVITGDTVPAAGRSPKRSSISSPRSASTSPTCSWSSRTRASTSSRSRGRSCWRPPRVSSTRRSPEKAPSDSTARRLGQPAAGQAGQENAADRRTVRCGDFRCDRRSCPQEAHAGHLRPGESRPAVAHLLAHRIRPPRLGRRGLRARSSTTQSNSTPAPRFVRKSGTGWLKDSGSSRALSTTTRHSSSSARRCTSWTPSGAPAAITRSTCQSRRRRSRRCSSNCPSPDWPRRRTAPGAG